MAQQPREKEKPTPRQIRYIAILSYKLGMKEPYVATYGEAGRLITELKKELEYRKHKNRKTSNKTESKSIQSSGTCYRDAWRYQNKYGGTLVHGVVHNQDSTPIKHAWVDLGNLIYEPQTNKIYDKEWFEKTSTPVIHNTYTVDQAAIRLAKEKAHGPWDDPEFKNIAYEKRK